MSSVVRSVLGAALFLTGASAAMAASDTPPDAYQSGQAGASTAVVASNSTTAAYQPSQPGAYTAVAASSSAPLADQSAKPLNSGLCDKADLYGGHAPASHWGTRAFWDGQSNTP